MKTHGRELFYMEEDDLLKYIKLMFDIDEPHEGGKNERQ